MAATGWTYWIVGHRGRRDDLGRDVEWAEVRLHRSREDRWERFEQRLHRWLPDDAPPEGPRSEADEAEADRLIATWVAMRMTPGRPLPPRDGVHGTGGAAGATREPLPWKGDLLRRLQLITLAVAAVVVLVVLLFR